MSARFLERIRPWAAAAVVVAVAGGLSAVFSPSHAGADSNLLCPRSTTIEAIAEPERLITKFDLTVFRNEFKIGLVIGMVHRWAGQVRIDLSRMPDRYKAYVERMVRDLSCLTGLRTYIHEEGSRREPSLIVIMGTWEELNAYARKKKVEVESLKHLFCNLTPGLDFQPRDADETFAAIGVAEVPSESETRHCLVKMTARAFGLFADSDVVQPSIFSPHGAELDYLPINDKIILRTLYDPRIERGMKREEAMEIVRQIIPELVKAARERGVEALYRR